MPHLYLELAEDCSNNQILTIKYLHIIKCHIFYIISCYLHLLFGKYNIAFVESRLKDIKIKISENLSAFTVVFFKALEYILLLELINISIS